MKRTLLTGALAAIGVAALIALWPQDEPRPPKPPEPAPTRTPTPPPARVAIADEAVPSFERGKALLAAAEAERHQAGLDIQAHRARLREAVEAFDESARLCKFHAMTYWLRGRARELLGEDPAPDYVEARRWGGDLPAFPVPTSLETARHDVPLLRKRAEERLAAGDLDGAQRDLELIIELADDPDAYERIAAVELLRAETEGRNAYVRGLRAVNVAMARDGWTTSRLLLRADLNAGVGFKSEAVQDLQAALQQCAPAERAAIEARLATLQNP